MTATSAAERGANPLDQDELRRIDAWWRAANYLSVGQIYLLDNPLLREPLEPEHVKPRLLGHWGTTPGLNLHLRAPEPGDPGARRWTRSTSSARATAGRRSSPTRTSRAPTARSTRASPATRRACGRLFRQFSFPGRHPEPRGARDARAPSTRAASSAMRCPTRSAPHSTTPTSSWPASSATAKRRPGRWPRAGTRTSSSTRRATAPCCPILHLNGYKIANPTVLARIPHHELVALFEGYGYRPYFVEGDDPAVMHQAMARTMDQVVEEIREHPARGPGRPRHRPTHLADDRPPLAQGLDWTEGLVDGLQTEGTFRSHQVPMAEVRTNPDHLALLEDWLRELPARGAARQVGGGSSPSLARSLPPKSYRRMSANPHANGGMLLRDLRHARLPRVCGRRTEPGRDDGRSHSGPGRVPAGCHRPEPRRTSG